MPTFSISICLKYANYVHIWWLEKDVGLKCPSLRKTTSSRRCEYVLVNCWFIRRVTSLSQIWTRKVRISLLLRGRFYVFTKIREHIRKQTPKRRDQLPATLTLLFSQDINILCTCYRLWPKMLIASQKKSVLNLIVCKTMPLSGVPKPFSDNQLYTHSLNNCAYRVWALQNGSDHGLKDAHLTSTQFLLTMLLLISIIKQYYQPIFTGLFETFHLMRGSKWWGIQMEIEYDATKLNI